MSKKFTEGRDVIISIWNPGSFSILIMSFLAISVSRMFNGNHYGKGRLMRTSMLNVYSLLSQLVIACLAIFSFYLFLSLCLLDKVQSKAIRLINNPNLTKSLQPLFHRRLVGDISIFYRYFHRHCSQEIRDIIPVPLRRVRTTRSSTHSHPFQVSLPNP